MKKNPSFSLVVPAYNEAHRLRPSLRNIVRTLPRLVKSWEVLVVDDGSVDATSKIVEEMRREHQEVRLIRRRHDGKGAAVKAGMLAARGEMIGFTDADLATPLKYFRPMIQALQQGYDIAIGSRALAASRSVSTQSVVRKALGYAFGWLVHQLLIANVGDTQCGCKLFTRHAARRLFRGLTSPGVLFDIEVMVRASRQHFSLKEIPVEWRHNPETRLSYTPRSALGLLVDLWRLRQQYGILRPLRVKKRL